MPFNLFKRSEPTPEPPPKAPEIPSGEIAFEGITEDWHLVGTIQVEGRLSDVLNRRERLPIAGVYWAPLDGSEPFTAAPGLQEVDPYDLLVVFTGKESMPDRDEETERALRVRKITYDVVLDLGLLQVTGRVYLYPGTEPGHLLERRAELFLPLTSATAFLAGRIVGNENADVLLVNQSYIRDVKTVEREAADLARRAASERASQPAGDAPPASGSSPATAEEAGDPPEDAPADGGAGIAKSDERAEGATGDEESGPGVDDRIA